MSKKVKIALFAFIRALLMELKASKDRDFRVLRG
jgi:hypothetical protein